MTVNCNQARQISIVEYLAKCGFRPQYIQGTDHWYLSPMRDENTASFKVNTKLNAWFDHGTGEGGNLIDLGIRLHRCSVEELLSRLSAGNYTLSFHQPSASARQVEPDNKIIIRQVSQIHSPELEVYIQQRGIDLTLAKAYCREVEFSIKGKTYTAVGFENRSGGYELRNTWFKGSSSPKDITLLTNHNSPHAACVVEGFIDFLSLLQLKQLHKPEADIVILNSVSLASRSIELLTGYRDIYLFLNYDNAGLTATEKIKQAGIPTIDAGSFYQGYNDVNAYLLAIQQKTLRQQINPQQNEQERMR